MDVNYFRSNILTKTVDSNVMGRNQLSPWNGVVSGTAAAIVANTLVYPLDMYDHLIQCSPGLDF